jgi:transcriptional regulator with XRE-family HTH domain
MYAEAPTETRAALVGHNIRAHRRQAGLSQTRLGLRIAVTQQQVSRWERGVWEPSEDSVRRIAGALGVDWTELYDFTDRAA